MRETVQGGMTPNEAAGFYEAMVRKVRDYAIFLLSPDGVIVSWNDSAARMKGFSESEVIGQHFRMLYPVEAREAGDPERNLREAVASGTCRKEDWRLRKDGSKFWALAEIIALADVDGRVCGYCKITADLSERRALQVELAHQKHMAQVTLRAIAEAVISVNAGGRIDVMNAQAERLCGWSESDAVGRPLADVLRMADETPSAGLTDASTGWRPIGHPLSGEAPCTLLSRDGTRYLIQGSIAEIQALPGETDGVVVVFRDVTAVHARVSKLAHQAAHDPLTGLVNRAEFDRRLEEVYARAEEGLCSGALLFLDLDGFKAVNDVAGHASGDRLLQQLAKTYRNLVRASDTLSRIGGDEFALLIENCTPEGALVVAQKFLEATRRERIEHGGASLTVGVSIGIAIVDAHAVSIEDLRHAADRACYLAKSKGRDRIELEPLRRQQDA